MTKSIRIKKIITRYGVPAELCRNEPGGVIVEQCKAIIQPASYRITAYLDGDVQELGRMDDRTYLYIGLPEPSFDRLPEGSYLQAGRTRYVIGRCEEIGFAGERLYTWALLRRVTGEDLDGYGS